MCGTTFLPWRQWSTRFVPPPPWFNTSAFLIRPETVSLPHRKLLPMGIPLPFTVSPLLELRRLEIEVSTFYLHNPECLYVIPHRLWTNEPPWWSLSKDSHSSTPSGVYSPKFYPSWTCIWPLLVVQIPVSLVRTFQFFDHIMHPCGTHDWKF